MTGPDTGYYGEHYAAVQRQGILGLGNSLLDRAVERTRLRLWGTRALRSHHVVELGASSGEHQRFVPDQAYATWTALDLAPGLTDPRLMATQRTERPGLTFVAADVHRIPVGDGAVDEVVGTCILHHVRDPEQVLREARRVLRPGGSLVIALPTDPGLANRTIKRWITYPKMRRDGLREPRLVYARDHVNSVDRILTLFRAVFQADLRRVQYRPLLLPSWNLNPIAVLSARRATD